MALDPVKNFAKVTPELVDDAELTIQLATGDATKLPSTSGGNAFNLVWWNFTDYKDPSDDPDVEIVRCTNNDTVTDIITVTRGQEGTAASDKNISGKVYKMIVAITKKMIDDINTASLSQAVTLVAAEDTPDEQKALAAYVCTGSDDQETINDALENGLSEVILLSGTYTVSDSIIIPSDKVFRGDKGSLITCEDNFISTATYRQTYLNNVGAGSVTQGQVFSLVVTAIDAENIIFKEINVDANGDAISNVLMAGILVDQASHVLLENCTSTNCALSINVNDANDGAFNLLFTSSSHCVVRGGSYTLSGYECIGARDGSYDILIDGAYCGGAVVHVAQSEGNEEIGTVANRSSHATWQNCTFDQANFGAGYSHNGFMCHSATHVDVTNCRFLDSSLAVICASSYINYTGNMIQGSQGCIIVQEQLAWSTPYNINISNNICEETDSNSGNHPIAIDGGKQINLSNNIVNVIYQGKDGIICYNNDIDGINISNNIVRGINSSLLPFNGINFNANGSKNVSITGNQVMGSNSGVQINTTTNRILVSGNKCLAGCGKGIYITGGSGYNLVTGNNLVDCSGTKVTSGATDSVYDNFGDDL